MEITFSESEYPGQVNVRIDKDHLELLKQLRLRKVKNLGTYFRESVQDIIRKATKEVEALELEKAG